MKTERLLLRPWTQADLAPFAAMNADAEVRRWFSGTLTQAESDASVARIQNHIVEHGFGFWAVEVPDVAPFIGFVGLMRVGPELPFAPAVETGWRLARAFWGKGYASEAAAASVRYGFDALGLTEIVSFAVTGNRESRRVMERIGMRHDPARDFDHPTLPEGDKLRRHMLYRIGRDGLTA